MANYPTELLFNQSVYFNSSQYEANKATQLNNAGSSNNGTPWTASAVDASFTSAGLTPLQHYQRYGAFEGIDPSDLFSTNSYYESKALQLSEYGQQYTAEQVRSAFQKSGIDPITHFTMYGTSENVYPTTSFSTGKITYASADEIQIASENRVASLATNKFLGFGNVNWNWNDLASTQGNKLYYMFPQSMSEITSAGYSSASITSGFDPLNQNQQSGVEQSFAELSKITGIDFVKTTNTSESNIFLFDCVYNGGGSNYSGGNLTGSQPYKAFVFFDSSQAGTSTFPEMSDLRYGSGNHYVVDHELGHTLGLKHPFQGSITLPSDQENNMYTLMSYTEPSTQTAPWLNYNTTHYGPYDIASLQYMYGTDGLGGNQGFVHA